MINAFMIGALLTSPPKVGDTAPDFTVQDVDAKPVVLSELVKKGPVVVAFFPKAFTGGCTKQLKGYQAKLTEFEKANAQIIVISTDDLETQKKFRDSLNAKYRFVADPEGTLVRLFDAKMPAINVAKRYAFVIGKDRKVLHVDEGGDAVEVSGALNACSAG